MKTVLAIVFSAVMLSAWGAGHSVAKEGKSEMVIVYNPSGDARGLRSDHVDKTRNTAQSAANYLSGFLKQITGADFVVLEESKWDGKSPAFLVGNTEFARKNGIDFSTFRPEEWLYKSSGKNLILGGGENFGQRIAINKFLENETGFRWLAFDGQYVPKKSTLELPELNQRGEPSFTKRSIYIGDQAGKGLQRKVMKFFRFNRNSVHGRETAIHSRQYAPEHSLYCVVDPDIHFKDHPEYFSMNAQGKRFHGIKKRRAGGGVCLTNPEVAKAAEAQLRKYIAADRKNRAKELWPNYYALQQLDSTEVQCLCPECKKMAEKEGGTEAGNYILFLNRISRGLARDYPEIKLQMLAYVTLTWAPKTIRPEKNILIQCCDNHTTSDCFRPLTHPINRERKQVIESWTRDGKSMLTGIWDYWHLGGPKYFSTPRVETMAQAIKGDLTYLYQLGIRDFFTEAGHQYYNVDGMFYDLQLYLGLQLLDDITKDDKQLIEEFMNLYYGPAAKPVHAAYRKLSEAVYNCPVRMNAIATARPYQTAALLKDLYTLLKEAQQSVPEESPERYRVERELLCVLQTMVYYENFRLGRSKEDVLSEFRTLMMRQLRYLYSPEELKKVLPKVEQNIVKISFDFKTPEKFASLPENDIRKFSAYDFDGGIVDDPESSLKKVVRIGVTHYLRQGRNAAAHARPCLDLQFGKTIFGVSNRTMKEDWRINVDEMPPQDEKYHWYCIRNCHLGAQSDFWAWAWNNRCPLDKVYRDGADNHWDVWFSLKMVGPSYVINSKQKNNFFLECIILTRPGAIK